MASVCQEDLLKGFPLHYCCLMGDVKGLQNYLSNTDLNPTGLDNLNYWTPAHWAVSSNHFDCLLQLAPYGALDTPAERSLVTPLHLAAEQGFADAVRLLLANAARVNLQDSSGDTPLHKAARKGHMECIKALLNHSACTDTRNFYGRRPSELSAMGGHFQIASALNEVTRLQRLEHVASAVCRVPLSPLGTLNPGFRNGYVCKRSRGCVAMDSLDDDSDKRLRLSDPVMQIAADMIGQKNPGWRDEIQSSLLEHAAAVRMAEAYEEYYSLCPPRDTAPHH
ncbi:hypothetical protein AAHC03_010131 [Spirometra sp. Aus1]